MATRTSTQARVLCYPASAIPNRYNEGFIVADILGDNVNLAASGAGLMLQAVNPTISVPWLTSDQLVYEGSQGVRFVRFYPDGTVDMGGGPPRDAKSEISGFILEGRIAALDCRTDGSTVPDGDNFNLTWVPTQGKWSTAFPRIAPRRNWIVNTGGDLTAKIRTKGKLPANRQLCVNIKLSNPSLSNTQPAFRFTWGDDYSIVGRHGEKFQINRLINGEMAVWRALENGPTVNANGGDYEIRIMRIAGRLVIQINEFAFWFAETQAFATEKGRKSRSVQWREAPLSLNAYNIVALTSVRLIKYANQSDEPYSGSFQRVFARQTKLTDGLNITARGSGWSVIGCQGVIDLTIETSQLRYRYTMTSNAGGVDTPFVNRVLIRAAPQWQSASASPLDIARAVDKASFEGIMSADQPGSSLSLSVDRTRLPSNWKDYIARDHIIEFEVREHFEDGTNGSEVKLFTGYIVQPDLQTAGFNQRTLTIRALDPLWRLKEQNAKVDYKYPPLDILFAAMSDSVGALEIWGSDCVKELINIALGPGAGDALNGNGNGERFFNGHYPLIDSQSDTGGYLAITGALEASPPSENGFLFPPPFDEDVYSWIAKIRSMDRAIFFYGWPGGYDGDFPVPIYGRAIQITAGRSTTVLPDRKYVEGDQNKVIQSVTLDNKPEKVFNNVQVWARGGQSDLGGLLPSVRMAEASLPTSDINAPEKSWKKSLILKEEMALFLGSAEAIALGTINELRNQPFVWPTFVCRGILTLQWGDKVQARCDSATSDPDLHQQIDGVTFRVMRVRHDFDWSDGSRDDFTTTIYARSLSSSGF